ncbi:MAG: FUN14 domain-containing protein [Deinococcota bacterium]|nr:FUN14 domain-containing protein [Deinococcota bacterium]
MPYLGQLTFGALAGFSVGYALKKVGKLLAVALGLLFITLQVMAYYDFVNVNWLRIQESVDPLLDADSLDRAWHGLVALLTANVPFAAAFVPGLLLGLRRG